MILITQQGGTGGTTLDSAIGDSSLAGVISSYSFGGHIADNDIQGGETFSLFGSTYIGMSLDFDVVYNANGIGSGILSGAADPTTEGNDGDWYINTTSNTVFGPKASGTWPAGISLVGPAGSVDAYYAPGAAFVPGISVSSSTSAYGTKGNIHRALGSLRITDVDVQLSAVGDGDSFELVLGIMSGNTASATISSVQKQTFTGATGNQTITLDTAYDIPRGSIFFVGASNITSGAAANPGIEYYLGSTDYLENQTLAEIDTTKRGVRWNDADIQNGDSPFDLTDTYWKIDFTYQPLNALLPIGGTAGQILSKINGTDYNVEWVDDPSKMVQTEITATAYSTVSGDFAGNVIRRMNNAATQTITIEPSMTGGQPVTFVRTGAGAVSFAAGVGVTIQSAGGNLSIADQYGSATLIPDATTAETYYLIGNLTT